MPFQKTGKLLHHPGGKPGELAFAAMAGAVLRGRLRDRPAAIEVAARWTGANERTVKDWFGGHCASRVHFFHSMVLHCPERLDAFLLSIDGGDRLVAAKLVEAKRVLREALALVEAFTADKDERT